MEDSDPSETIRSLFRTLSGGELRLRKPPPAKIEQEVLRQVFSPAHLLKNIDGEKATPTKPAGRRNLRVVPRRPKK